MGYYTKYRLTYSEQENSPEFEAELKTLQKYGYTTLQDVIVTRLNENKFQHFYLSQDGWVQDGEGIKWYNHHEDMIKLSKKFPHLLFKLEGEGEESGDIWIKYFLNGKSQTAKAQITFEEFNLGKLS